MSDWIEIDGSEGEGGGQVLRTSLALSVIVKRPLRVINIRARRRRPGLMRQHLTAVLAAAEIGRAEVEGATIGSTEIRFRPTSLVAGEHQFSVGSAGSATLVLQTVLPPLLAASAPSRLILGGGTHNPLAPPLPFLERAFLPIVERMGAKVTVRTERLGFYPAGGGRFEVAIEPCIGLAPLSLIDGGEVCAQRAEAIVAKLPVAIARRELEVVKRRLGWGDDCLHAVEVADSDGPGNVLLLEVERAGVREIVCGFGEKGVRAESVAERACGALKKYLEHSAPIGAHLADQLLVPFALAGEGAFRTGPLSQHTRTNIATIERFLPISVVSREDGERTTILEVQRRAR